MNPTTCECGGSSSVMESRVHADAVRRRRTCLACGARWTTYERRDAGHRELTDPELAVALVQAAREFLRAIGEGTEGSKR